MTVSSVAPIVAPVLGGVLLAATGSWRPMFYLLAAISAVLAAATAGLIPETLPVEAGTRWAAADRPGVRRPGPRPGVRRLRADGRLRLRLAVRLHLRLLVRAAGPVRAHRHAVQPGVRGQRRGQIVLGLLNARLVRRFPVRRLLVVGLAASTVAAAVLLVAVLTGASLVAVLAPLFVVVATRGLVSSNATVLGVQQAPAAGSASAVLGALMFAGGVLVTPLMALGGEGTALPMAAVVAGGAIAALLATALLTRPAPGIVARPEGMSPT